MKRVISLLGLGLCGALVGTSIADEAKPAPRPADPHFLEAGEYFFLTYPEKLTKKGTIKLGYKTDGSIEHEGATLFRDFTDRVYHSKTFFLTRPAKPEDLYVGRRIIYPRAKLESRAAVENGWLWNYGRISYLGELAKGTVLVAGWDPADIANGIRVIVGDRSDPEIKLTGSEDKHFFHPEHRLIYVDKDEPDADGHDVRLALQIKAPEKAGEAGTYLRLDNGDVVTTKHAYKSRPATKADLKAGLRIVLAERSEVPDRYRAYTSLWWIGNLTSYDHGIAKVGNGTVRVDAMRVVE